MALVFKPSPRLLQRSFTRLGSHSSDIKPPQVFSNLHKVIFENCKRQLTFQICLFLNRQLEQKWSQKKVKLHQKLALRLFQDDVKQVLDWLENHGEVFLRKNVGIGRNLNKAKAYQRSHQHFECVAQVWYCFAKKKLINDSPNGTP